MKKSLSPRQVFERSISEEDVFGACRQLLELNGARVHRVVERIPWGRGPLAKKSEPGIPDCFGWWADRCPQSPGRDRDLIYPVHFFIEFKKPGGEKQPAQIRWISEARVDGVVAFFADSVEAMVKGFAEFGIRIKGVS